MLFLQLIYLQSSISDFFRCLQQFSKLAQQIRRGKPNCIKLLLNIDEPVTKYWIDSFKDVLWSER